MLPCPFPISCGPGCSLYLSVLALKGRSPRCRQREQQHRAQQGCSRSQDEAGVGTLPVSILHPCRAVGMGWKKGICCMASGWAQRNRVGTKLPLSTAGTGAGGRKLLPSAGREGGGQPHHALQGRVSTPGWSPAPGQPLPHRGPEGGWALPEPQGPLPWASSLGLGGVGVRQPCGRLRAGLHCLHCLLQAAAGEHHVAGADTLWPWLPQVLLAVPDAVAKVDEQAWSEGEGGQHAHPAARPWHRGPGSALPSGPRTCSRCFPRARRNGFWVLGALTKDEPNGKAKPCHVAELQHEIDVEDNAQRWRQGDQRDLQEMELEVRG